MEIIEYLYKKNKGIRSKAMLQRTFGVSENLH